MSTRRISVVVTNYNYGRYLPECLDSVLAQTYANVECVVVDDGSTDDSRDILKRYASIVTVLQANAGQSVAAQNGFKASSGDIIVFLDSDDFLLPDACAEIAASWSDDLVAFHYRLQIYRDGRFEHRFWPEDKFRKNGDELWSLFTLGYVPAAPTSGNAYARAYVELVFREASGMVA